MYLNTNTNTFHFGKLKYKYKYKYLKKKYFCICPHGWLWCVPAIVHYDDIKGIHGWLSAGPADPAGEIPGFQARL